VNFRSDADDSDDVRRLFTDAGFQFPLMTDISNWYLGFNMLDPVVGKGDTPEQQSAQPQAAPGPVHRHRLGRGLRPHLQAQGRRGRARARCRRGCFGSREGQCPSFHNPVTHAGDGKAVRRPIEDAKLLLAEAGYPDGRDAKTGKPLVLNYDFQRAVTPEFKSENDWMVKQFAKLGIQLEIRATDFNQYQDKTLKGKHQIFWGRLAGRLPGCRELPVPAVRARTPSSRVRATTTPTTTTPSTTRCTASCRCPGRRPGQAGRDRPHGAMLQRDAPWSFGYFPLGLAFQQWVHNGKPSILIRDMAKYYRLDTALRARSRPSGTSRCTGRWRCWPLACWLAWAGASQLRQRETATARPASPACTEGDLTRCCATSCAAWATASSS
jgi:hypothetical protein